MVQAIPDAGDPEAPPVELSRQAPVDAVGAGSQFVTLHKRATALWALGGCHAHSCSRSGLRQTFWWSKCLRRPGGRARAL